METWSFTINSWMPLNQVISVWRMQCPTDTIILGFVPQRAKAPISVTLQPPHLDKHFTASGLASSSRCSQRLWLSQRAELVVWQRVYISRCLVSWFCDWKTMATVVAKMEQGTYLANCSLQGNSVIFFIP